MKIKLVSDLHIEFTDVDIINNGADVLILSGDILVADKLLKPNSDLGIRFRNFLSRVSDQFPHVVYVAGNHEFYGGYWNKSLNNLREVCSTYGNVHFLECDTKVIDDVAFIGGTLWTDMNKRDPITLQYIRSVMKDYQIVTHDSGRGYFKLKPEDTVIRHIKTLQYLKDMIVEHKEKKVVIVGHHSPSFLSCHEQYRNDHLMNGAYHSDLSDIMLDNSNIKLWTHGHTHHKFDYMIGNTRVVCNPRGYHVRNGYLEDTGWDPEIIIEV